jgi:hypothetical protein
MHGILSSRTAVHFQSREKKRVHLYNFWICNAEVWSRQKKALQNFILNISFNLRHKVMGFCIVWQAVKFFNLPPPFILWLCVWQRLCNECSGVSSRKSSMLYCRQYSGVSWLEGPVCYIVCQSDVTLHQNLWWPTWFARSLAGEGNFKAKITRKAMDFRKKCWAHTDIVHM